MPGCQAAPAAARGPIWSSGWPARARRRPACSPARGERVIGVDSGSPEGAAGLAGAGVEVILDGGRSRRASSECAAWSRAPGSPATRPAIAAARERGLRGDRRARALLAAAPEPLLRGHRHERQDHGRRAARPRLAHRRRAGRGRRQRRHAARLTGRRARAEATVVCEASSFQLEDTDAFAPECGVLLNLAPDHLDRHGELDDYRDAKLRDVRQPGRATTSRLQRRRPGARRTSSSPRCAARKARLLRRASRRVPSSSAAGPAQRRERGRGGGRRGGARGIDARRRSPRPARASPGSPTGSSGSPRSTASSTSTIRRPPTSPRPPRRCARSTAACGRSSAARSRAATSPGSREPVAERCTACYLIGEAAERLERELEPAWAAGVELRRCDDLADAVDAAAADASAGEVVLLAPGVRELRRLPRLRAARRALPRPGRGAAVSAERGQAQGRAADRVLAAAHRDPVPARLRRR